LNRTRTNDLAKKENAGIQPFRKLGKLIFGNACLWVLRELAANMLIPLMKMTTVNDARPVSAKDCDNTAWRSGQLSIMSERLYVLRA
jgi:hypothetical protein